MPPPIELRTEEYSNNPLVDIDELRQSFPKTRELATLFPNDRQAEAEKTLLASASVVRSLLSEGGIAERSGGLVLVGLESLELPWADALKDSPIQAHTTRDIERLFGIYITRKREVYGYTGEGLSTRKEVIKTIEEDLPPSTHLWVFAHKLDQKLRAIPKLVGPNRNHFSQWSYVLETKNDLFCINQLIGSAGTFSNIVKQIHRLCGVKMPLHLSKKAGYGGKTSPQRFVAETILQDIIAQNQASPSI